MLNMINMQFITAQVSSVLFWRLSCRAIYIWRGIAGGGHGFPGGTAVKNPPANARNVVSTLGQEDFLEEEVATHSSILA